MRKFERPATPSILTRLKEKKECWVVYGESYTQKRDESNHTYRFNWPVVDGKPLNQHLVPLLAAMTDDHCSYCDKYPPHKGDETIDHFRPKSDPRFYGEVCRWENLYFACKHCQDSKGPHYDELLLRPDELDYAFHRYFVYDYVDHYINPNVRGTIQEQQRAQLTIEVFDWNHPSMRKSRRNAFIVYESGKVPFIELPFRFMFD